MSTFSIHYVSSTTGAALPMHHGFTRRQLREAFETFSWYANSSWAGASAWILKRERKTIVHKPVTRHSSPITAR